MKLYMLYRETEDGKIEWNLGKDPNRSAARVYDSFPKAELMVRKFFKGAKIAHIDLNVGPQPMLTGEIGQKFEKVENDQALRGM